MILVDTSVWVDHFRHGSKRLTSLLHDGLVATHPFVVGELALLGHLRRRSQILALLADLPIAPLAEHEEALRFVDVNHLEGSGVGWVDVHLLCSAALDRSRIWTLDRRLAAGASRLGLAG